MKKDAVLNKNKRKKLQKNPEHELKRLKSAWNFSENGSEKSVSYTYFEEVLFNEKKKKIPVMLCNV